MHFEFNLELLLFIAQEMYCHKYGTFLGNCERERHLYHLSEKTESMWTYVLMEKLRFTNKFYSPENTNEIIHAVPLTAPFAVREWREFFFKWCEFGQCSQNPNITQSFFDGNTMQAINLYNNRDQKNELKAMLDEQLGVLKRLEEQIAQR